MEGIKNILRFLNDNWTSIVVCLGLVVGMARQTKYYMSKSMEEQVAIAKSQIKIIILDMIAKAEADYAEWNKSGSIKRSQVIKEIFGKYPILLKVVDQDEIINWLDGEIEKSLDKLKQIIG